MGTAGLAAIVIIRTIPVSDSQKSPHLHVSKPEIKLDSVQLLLVRSIGSLVVALCMHATAMGGSQICEVLLYFLHILVNYINTVSSRSWTSMLVRNMTCFCVVATIITVCVVQIYILSSNMGRGTVEGTYWLPLAEFKGWSQAVVSIMEPIIEKNCTKIFAGDREEVEKVQARNREWKNKYVTDIELHYLTEDCVWVMNYFQNHMYTTKLEQSFSMAYTFVVHNSPQQVLRLLKFLYRPTNYYCIHPDGPYNA